MFILFNCWFILVHPCAQDFKLHASLCSQLLEHYSSQYSDRRVYWAARERSANEGDMLTLICDSFDRSKLQLPMWPLNRTPKRTVYETLQRSLLALCFFHSFEISWIPIPSRSSCTSVSGQWHLRCKPGLDWRSLPWAWPFPLLDLPGRNERWQQLELGVRFLTSNQIVRDFISNVKVLFLNNRLWVWSSLSIRLVTH